MLSNETEDAPQLFNNSYVLQSTQNIHKWIVYSVRLLERLGRKR